MAIEKPFGVWESPVTSKRLAQDLKLRDVQFSRDGNHLVWLEDRSGIGVLVTRPVKGGAIRDLTAELSVRARVGYGGGDFTVGRDAVYFISERRLWKKPIGPGIPQAITPPGSTDLASPTLSADEKWVVYVYSDGDQDGLGYVDTQGELWPQKLTTGFDFYMQPTFSPEGLELSYIAWNHPNMPWDDTQLLTVLLQESPNGLDVTETSQITDGKGLVFQPTYSPDGKFLAFVHEVNGWSHVFLQDRNTGNLSQLTRDEAEYAPPAWSQGEHSLAWGADSQTLVAIRAAEGREEPVLLSWSEQTVAPLSVPGATYWAQISSSPSANVITAITSGDQETSQITLMVPGGSPTAVRYTSTNEIARSYLANAKPLTWKTQDASVHGLFYRPMNPDYTSIGLAPLIVLVHGGPTGHEARSYSAQTQYFTTRGFAVLRVNYRGSTGYGSTYRKALEHNWGVFDVADAVSGAEFCVNQGWVNPRQLVIMGGSAGGYTVMKALVDHPGFFKAGVSLFGVSNLFTLAAETHKFEARYLDSMLGPLPEASHVYHERSPIYHAEKIQDAMAIFQGEDDVVVPRNQADSLVKILERRGIPHFYEVYPGEGHGWRKAETIERFYESLQKFLVQYVIYG